MIVQMAKSSNMENVLNCAKFRASHQIKKDGGNRNQYQ